MAVIMNAWTVFRAVMVLAAVVCLGIGSASGQDVISPPGLSTGAGTGVQNPGTSPGTEGTESPGVGSSGFGLVTKAQPRAPLVMTGEVAVKIAPSANAHAVAATHGGEVLYAIGSLPGWWLMRWDDAATASRALTFMRLDARVLQLEHQHVVRRAKKTNDPFFANQWHLRNTGQLPGFVPGTDLNVESAWNGGRTGTGVALAIVDDGIERFHPDLGVNYDAALSFDFLGNDNDPSPENGDDHGTACAGIAAGRGENFIGIAGVAHSVSLAGIRLVGAAQTDAREGSALGHSAQNIDVYSNSWGPPDDGQYEAPGPLALAALQNGVTSGRGGLGSIYTWAAGNGGSTDWSNKDGFANLPETIAVSTVNGNQLAPTYAEGGANILVAGLAGSNNVVTTDLTGIAGSNTGSTQGNLNDANYTNNFDGTSAATPMVSGVAALMLQANPNLDWRSVQHILVRSSRRIRPFDSGWKTNGAGYRFHHRHGAGLVDANAAVNLAANWTGIPARVTKSSVVDAANAAIPDNTATGVTRTIDFTDTLFIEHVVVEFESTHTFWGDLEVFLVSPSGMESKLAAFANVTSATGPASNTWRFLSVQHWGEQAQGEWTLRVNDRVPVDTGALTSWRLVFHGTDAQIGATGGTVLPGSPAITQVTPNPVGVGSVVTVTGSNLAANPTLSITVGGIAQTPITTTATSLTFMIASGTPSGSQPITINNGIASVSTSVSIGTAGGGGGSCILQVSQGTNAMPYAILVLLGLLMAAAWTRRRGRLKQTTLS